MHTRGGGKMIAAPGHDWREESVAFLALNRRKLGYVPLIEAGFMEHSIEGQSIVSQSLIQLDSCTKTSNISIGEAISFVFI